MAVDDLWLERLHRRIVALPVWAKWLVYPAYFPAFIVVCAAWGIIGIVLMVVCLPYLMLRYEFEDRRRLRQSGRLVQWPDIVDSLRAGRGTLLITVSHKNRKVGACWWVTESLHERFLGPQLPTFRRFDRGEDIAGAVVLSDDGERRWVRWCHEFYLSSQHGKAALVRNLPRKQIRRVGIELPEETVLVVDYLELFDVETLPRTQGQSP